MPGLQMKYFVLKPNGTDAYAKASRSAMMVYAAIIRKENNELANDIVNWVEEEIKMCCDPIDATPEEAVGKCPECGCDVDKDGYCVEECCSYSPIACKTYGWQPCDQSC